MVKHGRPVVLHKKVRDPRQRARNRERQRKPPPAPQRHGRDQQRRSRQRAREVNRACTLTGSPLLVARSEEHTSELQSRGHLVCRLLLEKKKKKKKKQRKVRTK